jgi:glycosyltransferase involved in cell wall biosynthesis/tetratricopeptide (TPR) repeat protein
LLLGWRVPAVVLMSIANFDDLRAELIALEERIDAGTPVDSDRLRALAPAARHWARQSEEAHPIPRLARLMMRTNAPSAARDLLEFARPIARDEDCSIALMLANATAACGDHKRALDILVPLADANPASAQLATRTAELHVRLGNTEESLRLYRMAARLDKSRRPQLLTALIASGRGGEALEEARSALSERKNDPATRIAWFKALAKFSNDRDEVARARAELLAWLPDDLPGALWRAHLFRMEQDDEAAFAELNKAFARWPNDVGLRKARASAALALGYWGRDASAIYDAVAVSLDAPDLRAQIGRADKLLRAFGGSLGRAAANPGTFRDVRSPESVFALVAGEGRAAEPDRGKGLAMIAHSLTAGGAERIVALLLKHLRESGHFDWVKLYLLNLSETDGSDFFLPLTGVDRAEIVVLDRNCKVGEPFDFLPLDTARTAQAIHNQLEKDKPAIVHASLEPLTLYAGLAALYARVPRIVLHTHNMRPTDLYPDAPQPPRWRDCYRAMLERDEVSLVGCARASMEDYAGWIGLETMDKLHTVYNGLDFEKFQPAADPDVSARLRAAFGIARDVPVVGTAFKFRDEKRPALWVEAALEVRERYRQARFVMFGDGPLLAPIKDLVAAKGAGESFVFPGLVPDLNRYLPMLDLFMLCSSSEALPNVLLEAQASGVPVVAYHVGGIGETMVDGETGILVREDGAGALAAALLRAIDDPDWRAKASRAGAAFVRERFSPGLMTASLIRVLLGETCSAS